VKAHPHELLVHLAAPDGVALDGGEGAAALRRLCGARVSLGSAGE